MPDDDPIGRQLARSRRRRRSTRDEDESDEGSVELYFGPYALPKEPEPPKPRTPISTLRSVERQAYVELLWRMRYEPREIAELTAKHFAAGHHTVAADIREIQKRYLAIERDPQTIASRKARMRSSLEMLFQHSLASGDHTNASKTLNMLAKLDGLFAPTKIEHTPGGAVNVGLTVEKIVEALETDEELRAFEIVVAALERAGVKADAVDQSEQLPSDHDLGLEALDVPAIEHEGDDEDGDGDD